LNSVPEVLATIADVSLNQEWQGQRGVHLSFEDALEASALKRTGERRDQRGGGGRTYNAWISSLGLIFKQESTGLLRLTLAGEAMLAGEPPVEILKNQVLKYQFPSSFSIGRSVAVSDRFKIRPFRFLLKLLRDDRIEHLSQDEIAKVVIVDAETESDACYEKVVNQILRFRESGDNALDDDFIIKYSSGKGTVDLSQPYRHLRDIANTIINWIEYTRLAFRSDEDGHLRVLPEAIEEVVKILAETPPFIDRPEEHEFFQRKYGLDPKHKKDLRNLISTQSITSNMIDTQKIKRAFIAAAMAQPIGKVTTEIIKQISGSTGISYSTVEEVLLKNYPHGSIGAFMTEYFEMAFRGKDDATEFETATVRLFQSVFGFQSEHVGPIGLTPDVLIVSDSRGYAGIIDNKAYSKYTISNDHRNRMIQNYIGNLGHYYTGVYPLAFFSYIAGGFGRNIDAQIESIAAETNIHGSAMSVLNMIKLVEKHLEDDFDHKRIREIFSVNRLVSLADLA
jgi:hypothetical protein